MNRQKKKKKEKRRNCGVGVGKRRKGFLPGGDWRAVRAPARSSRRVYRRPGGPGISIRCRDAERRARALPPLLSLSVPASSRVVACFLIRFPSAVFLLIPKKRKSFVSERIALRLEEQEEEEFHENRRVRF